jgi:hypothetical protein
MRQTKTWRAAITTTAAALAVLTAGSATAAATPRSDRNLTTRTLFAEVHRAYRHVPAIELSVIKRSSTYRFSRRFVLVLRSGVVVAEEFTRSGGDGTTLVARRHHPTYSRQAGAKCWRRLPSSNPQTLADVGIPFPYTRESTKALQPQRTAFGWKVLAENEEGYWFLAVRQHPAHAAETYWYITYRIYALCRHRDYAGAGLAWLRRSQHSRVFG